MESEQRGKRLYQQVADQIAQAIAVGAHAVGERLPAERELAARYGVSRPTIREAIIALELAGQVEVRLGAGVYVRDSAPSPDAMPIETEAGAFELTEARLLIEGEVAALAASQITDAELAELDRLLAEMAATTDSDSLAAEATDRHLHESIARAARNSTLSAMVEQLWATRLASRQSIRLFDKVRAKGYSPVIAEHRAIVDALHARDPAAARAAMRAHLARVLDYMLDATEVEAIEEARARVAAQRSRFAARNH